MFDFAAVYAVMQRRTRRESQHEIAIASGISPNTLSRWKIGRDQITLKQLGRMADAFGITLDTLIAEIRAESGQEIAQPPPGSFPPQVGLEIPGAQDTEMDKAISSHLTRQVELFKTLIASVEELKARLASLESEVHQHPPAAGKSKLPAAGRQRRPSKGARPARQRPDVQVPDKRAHHGG